MNLKHQYIVDDQNRKIAVQLDLETFRKVEEVLENYALYHLIQADEDAQNMSLNDAKAFYNKLEKE